jgi:hypothetical protein
LGGSGSRPGAGAGSITVVADPNLGGSNTHGSGSGTLLYWLSVKWLLSVKFASAFVWSDSILSTSSTLKIYIVCRNCFKTSCNKFCFKLFKKSIVKIIEKFS